MHCSVKTQLLNYVCLQSLWDAVPDPRNSVNLWIPLGCLCQGSRLPGLCPSSEGQGDLFCPCFLRIQLDMCIPVERTKEGRSYASVEDHLQLQSKAENCKGQGLPKKLSGRSASHAAWLITPVPLALQSGGKTSLTGIVWDVPSARRNHSSTDLLLQLHVQGKGPNQSWKRSPVGAEEAGQMLGMSLCWKRGDGSDQCSAEKYSKKRLRWALPSVCQSVQKED